MGKKIFSGVQPTGNLHLGNYLGAIKNFVDLDNDNENSCIFCVVDLHAITVSQNPKELRNNIRETVATFLASGINSKKSIIGGGTLQKIIRFLKDTIDSADNLVAIDRHRTPISLKAYCLIFVYIFPMIYTPTIIYKIGIENPSWITYFIVILSEFILISLYNIQDQMEYPFDDEGLDDIDLDIFKMVRK